MHKGSTTSTSLMRAVLSAQVMSRIDALIHQAQRRGSPGEPVISVTF